MSDNSEKVKKPIYKKWWFWLIVIIIIGLMCSNGENNTKQVSTTNTLNQIEKVEETEEQKAQRLEQERIAKEKEEAEKEARRKEEEQNFKEEAETLTFEQLARNPEKIKGKKVKLTGEVIQTIQGASAVELRINITKGEYGYHEDTIYALHIPKEGEDKILEKDIVTIWGIAQGDYSYTSVLGSTITLPFVNVNYLEINK